MVRYLERITIVYWQTDFHRKKEKVATHIVVDLTQLLGNTVCLQLNLHWIYIDFDLIDDDCL